MKRHLLLSCSVALSLLISSGIPTGGQEAPPAPREDVPHRVERDRESDRRQDEPGSQRDSQEAEREELSRNIEKARRELQELVDNGHEQEAASVKERIGRWERRLNQLNRPHPGMGHPTGPEQTDRRAPRPEDRGPRGNRNRPDPVRMEHVKQAIEHLHAAGLHALADRLTQELYQRQQRLHNRNPGPPRGDDEMRPQPGRRQDREPRNREPMRPDFQRQLDDLRRQLDEMRRRMDAPPHRGSRRPESEEVW